MPLVVKDRVRETTTTTGTGTVSLIGAVTGFQSFSVIGDGNTTFYTIALDSAGEWEVGIGTYTASGTTLSRDIVLESSNSGSLVPFSSGTKTVFVTYPAEKSVYYDASGNVGIGTSSPDALLTVNTIASFGDGAVTTPSIAHKGDLNTGLWFPAADTIAVSTGGTERLRFDSAGDIDMASTSSLQKNSINAYTLKNITYLTSGSLATYTTPTGVRALRVTVVGGGGGAGGVDGQGASTYAGSSGGAGGGWAEGFITSVESSYLYTVGGGGAGGAAGNNVGASGGTSQFRNGASSVIVQGDGGAGGTGSLGGTSFNAVTATGGLGSITGVTGVFAAGMGSSWSRGISNTYTHFSINGGSRFGGGSLQATQPGTNARVYGEGGGSTYVGASTSNFAGGTGYQGIIIVEEYY